MEREYALKVIAEFRSLIAQGEVPHDDKVDWDSRLKSARRVLGAPVSRLFDPLLKYVAQRPKRRFEMDPRVSKDAALKALDAINERMGQVVGN